MRAKPIFSGQSALSIKPSLVEWDTLPRTFSSIGFQQHQLRPKRSQIELRDSRLRPQTTVKFIFLHHCKMASGGASPPVPLHDGSGLPAPTHGLSKLNPNHVQPPNNENTAPADPPKIKICVFCGSSPGTSPAHMVSRKFQISLIQFCNSSTMYRHIYHSE